MQDAEAQSKDAAENVQPAIPKVDLRVVQANERTLLAWVRTGLALMAFGFVVARLSPWLKATQAQDSTPDVTWTGVAFLLLGAVCNVAAGVRYVRIHTAIIEDRPVVPGTAAALTLALGLALLGALLALRLALS